MDRWMDGWQGSNILAHTDCLISFPGRISLLIDWRMRGFIIDNPENDLM